MAKTPEDRERSLVPFTVEQNPAPVTLTGQQALNTLRDLTEQILLTFQQVTASNYVSTVTGPFYTTQFQAMAEQLAQIQVVASEVHLDSQIDFTRPEFLWETVGTLVFPDLDANGIPSIDGDFRYRCFLKKMIALLLEGSKRSVQQSGVELLTDALVTVLAKVDFANDPNTAWKFADQFEFEVNVSGKTTWKDPETGALVEGDFGTGFPEDPFVLQKNVAIVLRALKPAHTKYDYRHLFFEDLKGISSDEPLVDLCNYYYDDFRKFCEGAKEITGTEGRTWQNRFLFSDVTRDFRNILEGATLQILTGPNASLTQGGIDQFNLGRYRVVGKKRLAVGADPTARAYTTSPSGLTGTVLATNEGTLEDEAQDWSLAVEGETISIATGPNAGTYRLETLLGNAGGPVGMVPSGSEVSQVRVAQSILVVGKMMPVSASGQSYSVEVQRLGIRTPRTVLGEDKSLQFYL